MELHLASIANDFPTHSNKGGICLKLRHILIAVSGVLLFSLFLFLFNNTKVVITSAPVQEPITLRVALWKDVSTECTEKIIDAFMRDHPNIKIETITYSPTTYSSSLEALVNGQQPADIFFIQKLTQLSNLSSKGLLKPLDFSLSQSKFSPEDFLCFEQLTNPEDGAHYALPYKVEKNFLYYNKDIFDELGIPYPDQSITWSEFRDLGNLLTEQILKKGEQKLKAILLLPDATQLISMTIPDLMTILSGDNICIQKSLHYMQNLLNDQSILPFSFCFERNYSQQVFETSNFAMFVGSSNYIQTLIKDYSTKKFNFKWGVSFQPCWPEETGGDLLKHVVPVCIYRYTEHPDAAWEFLSYVCGKEGASILAREMMIPAYMKQEIKNILLDSLISHNIDNALFNDTNKIGVSNLLSKGDADLMQEKENLYLYALLQLTPF